MKYGQTHVGRVMMATHPQTRMSLPIGAVRRLQVHVEIHLLWDSPRHHGNLLLRQNVTVCLNCLSKVVSCGGETSVDPNQSFGVSVGSLCVSIWLYRQTK